MILPRPTWFSGVIILPSLFFWTPRVVSADAMGRRDPKQDSQNEPPWLRLIEEELDGLYQLHGVRNTILARRDGLSLASVPEDRLGDKALGPVLAGLYGTSEAAMQLTDGGAYQESLVRGEEIEILSVAIGTDAVLGVVAERGALTGLLFMAIESSARKITEAIGES